MKKKGFVNGTFDVLHPGHLALISYARGISPDGLDIAIDSDKRIKEKKGENRPFFDQRERKWMLEQLRDVSNVYIFDSDEELENLIKQLKPHIMVVGSDWKNKKVIGGEFARQLLFYNRDEKYSTSKILNYGLDCARV